MKRTELKRKTPLRAKKWIGQGKPRKPLPKLNLVAKAKRDARYKSKLNNAHARAQRKRILIRAGGICECGCKKPFTESDPMQRGHLTYARFGHELDTDVLAVRRSCNLRERQQRKPYQRIA